MKNITPSARPIPILDVGLPLFVAVTLFCSCKASHPVAEAEPPTPKRFVVTSEEHQSGGIRGHYAQLIVIYDTVTSNETVIAKRGSGMTTVSRREIR